MATQGDWEKLRVALVHDELTRRGGAEIVLEELVRIFPQADVFSLYAGNDKRLLVDSVVYPIQTSYVQRFPLWMRRHPRSVLPFLAHAAEQFDFSGYDVVISSASAFAKAIIARVHVPHICYCHTPTRYLWDSAHEVVGKTPALLRWPGRVMAHYLRMVDYAAAQRVDYFIANSKYTQRRINQYYRRSSQVIYPPIDTAFFTPGQTPGKRQYFLCVGRDTPTKHFAQAREVCHKLNFSLITLNRRGLSREHLRTYYQQARAVLVPGIEDFGMVAAEALSCGTPVIGVRRGGVGEIVAHKKTGILYEDAQEELLAEALRTFIVQERAFDPNFLHESVLKFSRETFIHELRSAVVAQVARRSVQ